MTTPSTTAYEAGDVVLVRFPFTDLSSQKRRPAVVLFSGAEGSRYRDLIVMALTSRLVAESRPGEYRLQDWPSAGLLLPTMTKPLLATLSSNMIVRRLGSLAPADRQGVASVLRLLFGAWQAQ